MSLIIYPRRECITTPNYSCEIGENLYNSRSRGNIIIPPFFTRENKREIKFRKSIDLEMKVTTSLFVQRGITIERLEKIGEKKNLDIPFDWRFRILPPRSEFILWKRSSKLDNSASCVASRFIVTEAERIRIRSGFTGSRERRGGAGRPLALMFTFPSPPCQIKKVFEGTAAATTRETPSRERLRRVSPPLPCGQGVGVMQKSAALPGPSLNLA